MKLTAYRRHRRTCEHRAKGQHFTLCACPIWVYGGGQRRSLLTNNWERALGRIENMVASGGVFAEDDRASTAGQALSTVTEAFLTDGTARNLSQGTVKRYGVLLKHLRAFCGGVPLRSIDTALLDRFRQSRRRKNAKPLLAGTQRTEITVLRTFFRWCLDRSLIATNPARAIRLPKETAVGTLPFEAGEVCRLIAACDRIGSNQDKTEIPYIRRRARALVYVLLYSGLRVSDVAALRRDALDASGHLTIRHTKKTKVPVKVLLHEDAVKALAALPARHPDYFFWTGRSTLKTACSNVFQTIVSLGKLAGVKATPHKFRDTFAVELLTNGADIRTVQMLLGHESVRTTEKSYARFVKAHQLLLDRATAALDFEREAARPLLMHPRRNRRRNA